ncbi:stage V sporulation protein G [Persephonella hydrogeniphila]|uniref:Stage V sporulation protein G n=1 Tax=Persephonella hydrogeniphila TaxID=198703 RepID=A0A285NGZ1_9AQUI|nr:SpoVG family protein [Persephonella hydrogeniphila]SNZ08725.1 stage V sporulation protein G [Persephonella hydrogeniphila]
MEITEVKIYPFDTSRIGGRVRAVADITIDDILVIKGIKVVESKHGGLFISFPKKASSKGTYVDIVQSLDNEFTEKVRRAVVDKYKEMLGIT